MKLYATVLMAALAVQSGGVNAEDSGIYLGGKLGAYDIDSGPLDINELAAGGYFGYRFNQYVSVEAEYVHLFEDSAFGADIDGDLWVISVRPTLPLNKDWEIFAKLGWGWLDVEVDAGSFGSATEEDDDFAWGVGTTWTGEWFHVRGEVQADSDVPDFMIYTIGIGFDF